jgi:hypothetical protein
MIFAESFNKFYNTIVLLGFITLLISSCSSTKNSSLAYMDDIYFESLPPQIPVLQSEMEEVGEVPSNVPGVAYAYTPIPEPSIITPSPTNLNPYYTDAYSYDSFLNTNPYNPYGYYNPYGSSLNSNYFSFGLGYGYNFYQNPYIYCPPSYSDNGNTIVVTKRFSWADANPSNNQFTVPESSTDSSTGTSSKNTRGSNSKKSTFWNSLNNSGSSTNGNNGYNSGGSNSSRSSYSSPSRTSSGSSRSSGSSKSYSGKRQR